MNYKLIAALIPALLGFSVWAGVIPIGGGTLRGHDLTIDVPAEPAAVAGAIGNLPAQGFAVAIAAPGAVIDASAQSNSDGLSWMVRGDDGLAVELRVILEPLPGGGTRVRTRAVPGRLNAPALALAQEMELRSRFAEGIEAELDPLLAADRRLPPGEAEARLRAVSEAIATVQAAASPSSVGAAGAAIVADQHRLYAETAPRDEPSSGAEATNALAGASKPRAEISFEPGEPMVDVSR